MIPGHIPNATRVLSAPKDWDTSTQGRCGRLAIRDETTTAGPGMTSVWHPTPEELNRLQAGAGIYLTIIGQMHPPISMTVGNPPPPGENP